MDEMGTTLIFFSQMLRSITLVTGLCFAATAFAAGPIETSVFAVQGVEVDVTDADASLAKNKALTEVQIRAFRTLAERIGSAEIVSAVEGMEEKDILPFLKSLSIEQEAISPGRYQGKLTVRFLPKKVEALYEKYGVQIAADQGPAFMIVTIWNTATGPLLWEDNPWRKAWQNLKAEQSIVPIIVPLGDLDDSQLISAQDVLSGDEVKIEAIRRRYDVETVLIAIAEPDGNGGVHAMMNAATPLGKITFDKIYTAETALVDDSAALAVSRFHKVMVEKYRSDGAKIAAAKEEASAEKSASNSRRQSLSVAVPFAGPSQWNGLRSRILSTPGVVGLDVSSLAGDGAVISLVVMGGLDDLATKFKSSGLQLSRAGGAWMIQPL